MKSLNVVRLNRPGFDALDDKEDLIHHYTPSGPETYLSETEERDGNTFRHIQVGTMAGSAGKRSSLDDDLARLFNAEPQGPKLPLLQRLLRILGSCLPYASWSRPWIWSQNLPHAF